MNYDLIAIVVVLTIVIVLPEITFGKRSLERRKKGEKMPMICNWPDCGYVFPSGQKAHDKCPNCDRNPFATWNPETGKPITYPPGWLEAKKQILPKAAR